GSHSVRVHFSAVPGLSTAEIFAEGGLGGLASAGSPVRVTFSGGVGTADFPVNAPPSTVAHSAFTWRWKLKTGTTITEIGTTGEHVLYTLLARPRAPQAVPWVATLEVATTVARGETTAENAMRRIWSEFYTNAGGRYDTEAGRSIYTTGGRGE